MQEESSNTGEKVVGSTQSEAPYRRAADLAQDRSVLMQAIRKPQITSLLSVLMVAILIFLCFKIGKSLLCAPIKKPYYYYRF